MSVVGTVYGVNRLKCPASDASRVKFAQIFRTLGLCRSQLRDLYCRVNSGRCPRGPALAVQRLVLNGLSSSHLGLT